MSQRARGSRRVAHDCDGSKSDRRIRPLSWPVVLFMIAACLPAWEDPTEGWKRLAAAVAPSLPLTLNQLLLREQGEYLRGLWDRDVCPFAQGAGRAAIDSARLQAELRARILSRTLSSSARARALGLLGHQIADHVGAECGRFQPETAQRRIVEAFSELWRRLGESTAAGRTERRRAPPPAPRRAQRRFTNHDLQALPPAPGVSRVTAEGMGASIAPPDKGLEATDRKRFSSEARRLRVRLEHASSEVEQLQAQIEQIERERRRGVEDRALRSLESSERRLRERLGRAEAALELDRRELDGLEQRARRAGMLPGDLRD